MFVAKVQAELMAQHKDQHFVNHICQLPEHIDQLVSIREQAYFRRDATAPFIAACHVLCASLTNIAVSEQDKVICASLLAQRLEKVAGNPPFRLKFILIFGEIEEKFANWVTERSVSNH